MDSFSAPPSGSSQQINPQQFMDQLQTQLAQAYAEEFLETVRGKCFEKCITKPGSSLSGGESSCISRCVDRYIEATGIVINDKNRPIGPRYTPWKCSDGNYLQDVTYILMKEEWKNPLV